MSAGSSPIPFAANPLDRASERRGDAAWIAAQLAEPRACIVPFRALQPFLIALPGGRGTEPGFLDAATLRPYLGPEALCVFLGMGKSTPYFALDVTDVPDPERSGPLAGLGRFAELRGIAMSLAPGDAAILAQAKALIDWHRRHGFCAQCGGRTTLAEAGYKRVCPACGAEHFPRTDPVAIMLATRGDLCLLGRGPQWPKGFYSALAGFVEPGETIAQAVIRELKEEAGITAHAVRFHTDQPWPYPSSLMIGCFAEAQTEDIRVDGTEIEDARWFSRAEAQALLAGQLPGFFSPPPLAIAHHLLKAWVEGRP